MPRGIFKRPKQRKGRECYIENHVCKIPLNNGEIALCDEDRFAEVNKHNWSLRTDGYANARFDHKRVLLHGFLYQSSKDIDHINGNKLDNRSCNLRYATRQENCMNRSKNKNNTLGYKGVRKEQGGFAARIGVNYKKIYVGFFKTIEEAALAYDKRAKEIYGDFAKLNFNTEDKHGK